MKLSRRNLIKHSFLAALAANFGFISKEDSSYSNEKREENTYRLSREIPVLDGYDIVVAGGGPSGVSAAISAGRLGVKVLLVEATGALGGMGTSGLVSNWSNMSDGENMHCRGLFFEILKELHKIDALTRKEDPEDWGDILHARSGFDQEELKILLDKMCLDAGVDILYETRLIDADADLDRKFVNGVVIQHIEGYNYVPAKAFIDGTGLGTLAHLCGAPARRAGRDTEHIMPPTLCGIITDFERPPFDYKQEKLLQAFEDNFFTQNDRAVPGLFTAVENWGTINAGHLFGMDALDVRSLTAGYIKGRKLAKEYANFYKTYFEANKNLNLITTANLMGIREARAVHGEYELKHEDLRARRYFPDQIAVYCKRIDVHVYDTSPEQWERFTNDFFQKETFGHGENFGLAYGILVPKGWQNLWVAGRHVSADVMAHGSIRDQPACYMEGQAAGTAAAQSIKTGEPGNKLNTKKLVETLRNNGAFLPQDELSEQMTRS